MGDADGRTRERDDDRRPTSRSCARFDFPHSLGMLYSTFTAYLGFAVNEGEYKVMGLAAYGRPTMIGPGAQADSADADGAFALDLEYFEFQTTAERSYSSQFVELFGPPRAPLRADRSRDRRRASVSPTAPPACSACSKRCWSISRASSIERPACPNLCFGGGVALNGVANAPHSCGVGVRARVRAERAGRRRMRAGRGALRGSNVLRQSGSRGAGSSVLGSAR